MIKYLLVEGITDVAFIKYICFKNKITQNFNDFKKIKNEYKYKDFIIVDLQGQHNLNNFLIRLNEKIAKVSQIAIIQDADNDFDKSMKNIKNGIKNSKLDEAKIPQKNIFITPNNKDTGDLETLLLSTIENNSIIKCFKSYKICLKKNEAIYEKALNKGQVYAYTMYSQSGKNLHKPQDSFMFKYENEYIDTKLWDLTKDEFQPIIKFIIEIFGNKV